MKRPVLYGLALTSMLAMLPLTSCKKDEPPPPLPSAAPQAAPPPQQVELQPIAEAVPDAAAPTAAKKAGGSAKPASIAACCAALEQNAANAPEPNKTYMMQAAAFCKSQGGANPAFVGILQGILKTANLPTTCK